KEANPYTFTYFGDEEQTYDQIEQDIQSVNHLLGEREIEAGQVTTEPEYYVTGEDTEVLIASESMYNDFADLLGENTIHLENKERIGDEQCADIKSGYDQEDYFVDNPVEHKNGEQL